MADRTPFPACAIDLAMKVALIWAEANVENVAYVEAAAFGESAGKVFLAALVPFDGDELPGDDAPKKPILPTSVPDALLESMRAGMTSLVLEAGKPTAVRLPTPRDLVDALLKAGFTQAQIAIEVGTTQATVSKIKRGAIDCVSVLYRALFAFHSQTCKGA